MRAQVLEAFNTPYVFRDVPEPPAPRGSDLLIRVEAASYCHTDAVFASGAMQWRDLPRVGCHEFAGTILALGPTVPASLDLAVGQRVGVPGRAYHCCGDCRECRLRNDGDPAGYGVHCTRAGNLGLSADGGFQERCTVDARQVAPVPEGLQAVEVAPLMCAGLTIWNALERGGVRLDGKGNEGVMVAISGAGGGLGHLGVQFAAKLGCDVMAIDASDRALRLLRDVVHELGPLASKVTVVDARTQRAEEARFAVCGAPEPGLEGEKGADCVLVLPEPQQALDFGVKLLRNHGICVCVSFPKEGFHIQPADLVFRHIEMVGVLVGRNRQLRAMLQFAAIQGVRAKTTTYPLERLNELVEDYHQGTNGKLVIDMAL
ncbi:putative alcohol dehydrogenase protein [Botryosphaeria dothidea]|uniref:Alcohol dehydrogenase protein n=1 Tax=Botryosphaeria dothidea TaxID=55169 RepID=A0A8H4J0J8_9PEZI|nr:putative alcohol dehydrogenase protein [Botryosphaeria dothidea]